MSEVEGGIGVMHHRRGLLSSCDGGGCYHVFVGRSHHVVMAGWGGVVSMMPMTTARWLEIGRSASWSGRLGLKTHSIYDQCNWWTVRAWHPNKAGQRWWIHAFIHWFTSETGCTNLLVLSGRRNFVTYFPVQLEQRYSRKFGFFKHLSFSAFHLELRCEARLLLPQGAHLRLQRRQPRRHFDHLLTRCSFSLHDVS